MIIRFLILIIIIFASAGLSLAQTDSLQIKLAGIICTNDTSKPPAYVHIINKRTGAGVISDSLGIFKIKIYKTDSLIFKSLGFADKIFTVPDTVNSSTLFVKIILSEISYSLKVINIIALSRYKQFGYDFTHFPMPDNLYEKRIIIPGVTKYLPVSKYKSDKRVILEPVMGGASLISILYYQWSKYGRSILKVIELIDKEEKDKIIEEKFNMKLLSKYTGFTGDTLIDFKQYLNYSRTYLLNTNQYDIFIDIKQQLPEFKKNY
jgi:hypothetical protein